MTRHVQRGGCLLYGRAKGRDIYRRRRRVRVEQSFENGVTLTANSLNQGMMIQAIAAAAAAVVVIRVVVVLRRSSWNTRNPIPFHFFEYFQDAPCVVFFY